MPIAAVLTCTKGHGQRHPGRAGRRERNPQHTGNEDYNWFLCVLFPASELKILPYNRIVVDLNGLSAGDFLAKVKSLFGLQENAARVNAHVMQRLGALRHPLLAEVRGNGLFFGAEFVLDDAMTPATDFVTEVVERMVQRGFLLNRIGRAGNTLKIRPPMPFSVENGDMLMDALEAVLAETPVPA